MKKSLSVVIIIFCLPLMCQGQEREIEIGIDARLGRIILDYDLEQDTFIKIWHPTFGGGLEVKVPLPFGFWVTYDGSYDDMFKPSRIKDQAREIREGANAKSQKHTLIFSRPIYRELLNAGVGVVGVDFKRRWLSEAPAAQKWDQHWHGVLISADGEYEVHEKISIDYQFVYAPWLKRGEDIEFRIVNVVLGIRFPEQVVRQRQTDQAYGLGAELGFTYWVKPYLGARFGGDYFSARGDVSNPERYLVMSFSALSFDTRFRF